MNKTYILFLLITPLIVACDKNDDGPNPNDPIPGIINVPADQPTIQEAIDAAVDEDTILVADGTYYENINFKGKAITIASRFLIDGDKSHMSKTIIDGSQSDNPDKASVVSMVSGEDTSSILCGFTLTEGKGTLHTNLKGTQYLGGGGVHIFRSGGKIENNIIEDNHLTDPATEILAVNGCGINAWVFNHHTAIIRNNIIRNNTYNGNTIGAAGGIMLGGGRFIVEGNTITDNIINSETHALGGGIAYGRLNQVGVID